VDFLRSGRVEDHLGPLGHDLLGKKLRLFLPAPERLQRIATETSAGMNIPFSEVLLMRISLAQLSR